MGTLGQSGWGTLSCTLARPPKLSMGHSPRPHVMSFGFPTGWSLPILPTGTGASGVIRRQRQRGLLGFSPAHQGRAGRCADL